MAAEVGQRPRVDKRMEGNRLRVTGDGLSSARVDEDFVGVTGVAEQTRCLPPRHESYTDRTHREGLWYQ